MKQNLLLFLFSITTGLQVTSLAAQQRAVTESGDTIFIYDNGTWSFELEDDIEQEVLDDAYLDISLKIDTILTPFVFDPKVNKEVIPKSGQFKFKYDNEAWKRVPPADLNDDAEFAFQNRSIDIWAIIIAEQTEISIENIFKIAKNTMEENTGEKAEIKQVQYLTVNDTKVLRGTLETTFSGISFIFDTLYYSDEKGTTQFTTWTSQSIWENNESLIFEFLSGFMAEQ